MILMMNLILLKNTEKHFSPTKLWRKFAYLARRTLNAYVITFGTQKGEIKESNAYVIAIKKLCLFQITVLLVIRGLENCI